MDKQDRSQVLVARAQEGDRAAFDELVDRYRARVASLLRARLGGYLRTRVDVEDLLQEVFLRAFSCLTQFRWSEDEALFRWLSTIAGNVVHEIARIEKRELLLPSDENLDTREVSPTRAFARHDRFDRLRTALDGLKPEYREVILLARIQRLPIKDVADRIGRPPRATTQLLLRALKKLKSSFGDTESLSLPDRSLLDEEVCSDD